MSGIKILIFCPDLAPHTAICISVESKSILPVAGDLKYWNLDSPLPLTFHSQSIRKSHWRYFKIYLKSDCFSLLPLLSPILAPPSSLIWTITAPSNLAPLESIPYTSPRVIFLKCKSDYVTPLLKTLLHVIILLR